MDIKIMAKAKHTLNKHNLGRLGLKPISSPLFFWVGSSPTNMGWAGLGRARSLAQASDPAGQ